MDTHTEEQVQTQTADAVRMTVTIGAAAAMVWEALVSGERLAAWFAEHATLVPVAGDAFRFGGRYTPGAPEPVQGLVQQAAAPHSLRFLWPLQGRQTHVAITLTTVAEGTRLDLLHTGLAHAPRGDAPDLQYQLACFWENALLNLRQLLERGSVGLRLDFAAPATAVVEQQITIEARPERVWRALTDPAELNRWIADAATVELRPGGAYTFGGGWGESGSPVAIVSSEPPHRLVHSWMEHGQPSLVTWTLTPVRDGQATLLAVRHEGPTGLSAEQYRLGWAGFLNRLWLLHGEQLGNIAPQAEAWAGY